MILGSRSKLITVAQSGGETRKAKANMDRWQLWRRVWLRLHGKHHSRRRYALAARTRSDPEGRTSTPPVRYLLGRHRFSFVNNLAAGLPQRPKVLLDIDCSDLLMGGSQEYENFSSTCWLEDHLHRFGAPTSPAPPNRTASTFEFHSNVDLETSSSMDYGDEDESFEDFSVEPAEEADDIPSTNGDEPRSLVNNTDNEVINLHRYPYVDCEMSLIQPPPYPNEPPPSYEEAIAGNSFHDNENSDFLW